MLPLAPSNQMPSRPGVRLALAIACAFGIGLASTVAFAQSDADRATARALAAEGFQALQRGDYDVAEDRFRRADTLVHAPTLVVDRGRALMGMRRYVAAQEQFELVLREGVPDDAPPSWKTALEEAAALLEQVKPKVAWLTVAVPDVANAEVKLDGQPIPHAALGVRRAADPGTRTIDVSAPGYLPRQLTVELYEGGEEAVEVSLEPLPEDQSPTPPPPTTAEQDQVPLRPLPYAALGVGGVGLVVGSVAGALAIKKHADLAAVCSGEHCTANQQSAIDTYHRLGWTSGVGFAVGLAGATTGLVLLLRDKPNKPAQRGDWPRLQVYVGPGVAGLRGTIP